MLRSLGVAIGLVLLLVPSAIAQELSPADSMATLKTAARLRQPEMDDGWQGEGNANAQPPPGWKEYTPKDRTYSIWVPAVAKSQQERERSVSLRGQAMKSNILTVEMSSGLAYNAWEIILENASTQESRAELEGFLRDLIASEIQGRVVAEDHVTVGTVPGKEYRIESGALVVRMRVFVAGNWVLLVQVLGTRAMVESDGPRTFFTSCRISPGATSSNPGRGMPGVDRRTKIQGGFNDPEFVDESPQGGVLVGAEVGLGRYRNNPVSHAARPIYRVGDREVEGTWHGPTQGKQLVRAVAKPGYAVGAITIKNGLTVDGFSLTFMRVADGRLDPRDSYESPWLGGRGGGEPVKLGGDGTLVVGLIGKAKDDAVTGLGLLFFDPGQAYTVPAGSVTPQVSAPPQPPAPSPQVVTTAPLTAQPPVQAPPVEKSSVLLLLGGMVGGAMLVLGTIAFFVYARKSQGSGGRGRRYEDDDDDDEDDRRSRNRGRGRHR